MKIISKEFKWEKRDRKNFKKKNGMRTDGKLSTQTAHAFHSRIPKVIFCEICKDFRKLKNGKCKKCGKRYQVV